MTPDRLAKLGIGVFALAAFGLGIATVFERSGRASIATGDRFVEGPREILYSVNDAGVGDLDGDGRLDWWTTNHSALEGVSLQRGGGRFSANSVHDLGLSHDREYPGLEAVLQARRSPAPIWLHAERMALRIEVSAEFEGPVRGAFSLPWEAVVEHIGGGSSDVTVLPGGIERRIAFEIPSGATLSVTPVPAPSDGFPLSVSFDEALDLEQIGVGEQGIRPGSHRISFHPKDRHAYALADVVGSDAPDLFVSRGGARGRLSEVDPDARDELFAADADGYRDVIAATGITKQSCPGRQAAWVDVDSDGDLDLYQVCGRDGEAGADVGNRLYVQGPPGRFEERAHAFGLDLPGFGSFAWIFAEDGTPGLLWVTADTIEWYERRGTRFTRLWHEPFDGTGIDRIALGTANEVGRREIVVVSPRGNRWLEIGAAPEDVVSEPAASHGLPERSADGGFVDVDFDGTAEFFAVPQGLHERRGDGRFEADGTLAYRARRDPEWARGVWFDADADGDLDLWLVVTDSGVARRSLRRLHSALPPLGSNLLEAAMDLLLGPTRWYDRTFERFRLENRGPVGHWLHLDVEGPAGNREAIGARIRLRAGERWQTAWVGQREDSRFSQTHHRVYFGLGEDTQADEIQVAFADGERIVERDISAGQQILLRHPQAAAR